MSTTDTTEKSLGFGRTSSDLRDNVLPLSRVALPGALATLEHEPMGSALSESPKSVHRPISEDVELSRTPTLHFTPQGEVGDKQDMPVMSRTKMLLLALGMMLTYFLGVSQLLSPQT